MPVRERRVARFGQGVAYGAAVSFFALALRRRRAGRAPHRQEAKHASGPAALAAGDVKASKEVDFDPSCVIDVFNATESAQKTRKEQLDDMQEDYFGKLSEAAFERLYGEAAPEGFGSMLVAHVTAPMAAYGGDGAGAVDSVCKAVGGMMGGVFGGPVGAFVGEKAMSIPAQVINYFDLSAMQAQVRFVNYTPYNIRFACNQTDYYHHQSTMKARTPEGRTSISNAEGLTVPPAATAKSGAGTATYITWQGVFDIYSKFACVSFQLEALTFSGGRRVRTYDCAFQFPGSWSKSKAWVMSYNHMVGVFEDAPWKRQTYHRDNYEPCEKMQAQTEAGRDNRPASGTSGESIGYWDDWRTCVFEFH